MSFQSPWRSTISEGAISVRPGNLYRVLDRLVDAELIAEAEPLLLRSYEAMEAVQDRAPYRFVTHLEVEVDGEWVTRGSLRGGGPIIHETRTIPLDLTGVEGDEVRLAFTLPSGSYATVLVEALLGTVEEAREALTQNILAYKVHNARSEFSDRAVEQLVAEVDLELPQSLVDAEAQARIQNLLARLESDNIGFEDYLRIIGRDQAEFVEDVRSQATSALATRVVVETIVSIEGTKVEDDEYREALEAIAANSESTVEEIEKMLADSGQVESLTGDILRRKALDRVADAAVAVDADGNIVDLTPVVVGQDDDDEPTGDDGQDDEASPEIEE